MSYVSHCVVGQFFQCFGRDLQDFSIVGPLNLFHPLFTAGQFTVHGFRFVWCFKHGGVLEGWNGRKRSGRNTWRRRTKKSSGGKHGEQGGKKAKKAKKAEKIGKKSRSSPTVVDG